MMCVTKMLTNRAMLNQGNYHKTGLSVYSNASSPAKVRSNPNVPREIYSQRTAKNRRVHEVAWVGLQELA